VLGRVWRGAVPPGKVVQATIKPIGVADLQLTRLLPQRLEGALPTVEQLEAELADLDADDGGDGDNDNEA